MCMCVEGVQDRDEERRKEEGYSTTGAKPEEMGGSQKSSTVGVQDWTWKGETWRLSGTGLHRTLQYGTEQTDSIWIACSGGTGTDCC